MRKFFVKFLWGIWISWLPLSSFAAVIAYNSQQVSSTQWRYDYEVTATASDPSVEEFTIYFDHVIFQNIAVSASPENWDSIVIQPDVGLSSDGFFDSLALDFGIAPGSSQAGFHVTFNFLGTGLPLAQRFDIVDPVTFATISSGMTLLAVTNVPPTGVPEPTSIMLISLPFAFLFTRREKKGR
jgi:hypothetical protein